MPLREKIIKEIQICPECRSVHLIEHLNDECTVCSECGLVIPYKNASTNSHIINKDQHEIHPIKTVSSIQAPKLGNKDMISVLEKWKNVRIADSIERNLAIALEHITKIAIDLSIPKIALEKACLIYRRIIEEGLLRGKSIRMTSATALYMGCKQCRIAVTIKEIAHISKMSPRKISHSYRLIAKQLDFSMQPMSVNDYSNELCTRLKVSLQTSLVIDKIIYASDFSKQMVGKDPIGITCAAIYIGSLLAGEKRTQREISEIARITEATIRARCRELERNLVFNVFL